MYGQTRSDAIFKFKPMLQKFYHKYKISNIHIFNIHHQLTKQKKIIIFTLKNKNVTREKQRWISVFAHHYRKWRGGQRWLSTGGLAPCVEFFSRIQQNNNNNRKKRKKKRNRGRVRLTRWYRDVCGLLVVERVSGVRDDTLYIETVGASPVDSRTDTQAR